jgi:hypothetical protein
VTDYGQIGEQGSLGGLCGHHPVMAHDGCGVQQHTDNRNNRYPHMTTQVQLSRAR